MHWQQPDGLPPLGEPTLTRPGMPGYGLPEDLDGALPWSWAVERLTAAHNYWVATIGRDGAPHATAVWAVWLPNGLYFDAGPASLKARNLARDPRVVITTERADEAVILHGRAIALPTGAFTETADVAYATKYGSAPPGQRFLVRPTHAFAFIEHAEEFGRSATRWTFE